VNQSSLRVCHVITGLELGGAESMLLKLCRTIDQSRVVSSVVSLRRDGLLAGPFRDSGVALSEIGVSPGSFGIGSIRKLRESVSRIRPDVVHGWMYHGNLAALVATAGFRRVPVCWNIRQTIYDIAREKPGTRAVIRANRLVSTFPTRIVYNSSLSAAQHAALGFSKRKSVVLPNGFDANQFAPSLEAKASIRRELELSPDSLLIGLIARAHPMKDHALFFKAARIISQQVPSAHFLLAGDEATQDRLGRLEIEANLAGRVSFLGPRSDIARITAALDVACLTSAWGEGFPNVMAEAMACEVACVATDVGDVRHVLGDGGIVVEPGNAKSFATACVSLLSAPRRRVQLGEAGRRRVLDCFSIAAVADAYSQLYESVALHRQG